MGAKKRVNITIDPETLRLADRTVRRRKVSRSELIGAAIQEAAETQSRCAAEEERSTLQRRAIRGMRRLARHFGDWPAEEILRSFRDKAGKLQR